MTGAARRAFGGRRTAARAAAVQLLALGLVAGATAARLLLDADFPDLSLFSLYFPAVLLAALGGGWPAAATALTSSALAGWWFFILPDGRGLAHPSTVVNLGLFVASAAAIGYAGVYVRTLIARLRAGNAALADRERRYHTLFDAVSEGFALVEAIRDESGRLVDYMVLEANPAILQILGLDHSVVGRRHSEIIAQSDPGFLAACDRALSGQPVTLEHQSPRTERFYEVRLSAITESQLAQFVVDVTDRKAADARHTELFDELNHRMKNNLAMISSMLALQARTGEGGAVRGHLMKAVDRIQAIADVHASLYRGSRKDDVDFAAYLTDLCQRLAGSLLETDRVKLEVTAEPAVMPLDRAVALGVIVNELVTNAAKHAYPAPTRGVISVRLSHAPAALVVSVADLGQGLSPSPVTTGLGMRLVRSLVQQIGATLEIERGPGATFSIRVPEAPARPVTGTDAGQARLF